MRLRFPIYFTKKPVLGTTVGYERTGGFFSMLVSKNENSFFFVTRVQKIHGFSTLPTSDVMQKRR
jgi:hypothetical protein